MENIPPCSPLFVASKNLPFPIFGLGCYLLAQYPPKVNPVLGNKDAPPSTPPESGLPNPKHSVQNPRLQESRAAEPELPALPRPGMYSPSSPPYSEMNCLSQSLSAVRDAWPKPLSPKPEPTRPGPEMHIPRLTPTPTRGCTAPIPKPAAALPESVPPNRAQALPPLPRECWASPSTARPAEEALPLATSPRFQLLPPADRAGSQLHTPSTPIAPDAAEAGAVRAGLTSAPQTTSPTVSACAQSACARSLWTTTPRRPCAAARPRGGRLPGDPWPPWGHPHSCHLFKTIKLIIIMVIK